MLLTESNICFFCVQSGFFSPDRFVTRSLPVVPATNIRYVQNPPYIWIYGMVVLGYEKFGFQNNIKLKSRKIFFIFFIDQAQWACTRLTTRVKTY